ncbi:MAG: DsbA family protein [Candidatus Woesearchaeota archaeon]
MTNNDSITITKLTLWQGLTGLFAALLVLSIATGGFGFGGNAAPRATGTTGSATQGTLLQASGDNGNTKGNPDAPVTITKYSSFSCGFCNTVRPTLDQVMAEYGDDVKIVYKHFDRTNGGVDSRAAQATECAGEQGQFWEMHDMIFDRGPSGNVQAYAQDLGLDMNDFNECLNSQRYAELVQQHTNEARSLGFSGTPSFKINDGQLVGAQPFPAFQQAINAELARVG